MTKTKQLGRFVWHDLMTKDLEASKRFYTELFGWRVQQVDMGPQKYDMIHAGEQGIGGIVALDGPETEEVPSHWVAYAQTDDIEACCARAEAAGGQVRVPPTDIPGQGRFAVLADPEGAVIAAFENAAGGDEQPPAGDRIGHISWVELLARDVQGAKAFYTGVFSGWSFVTHNMGPAGDYHAIQVGGQDIGGMIQIPDGAEARQSWMPYVTVADVDASASKAKALGAGTREEPKTIPGVGRFSVHIDPTGATFALYTASATK